MHAETDGQPENMMPHSHYWMDKDIKIPFKGIEAAY